CKCQEQFISLLKSLGKIVERVFVVFSLFPSHTWLHLISGAKRETEKVHKEFDIVIENIIKNKITRIKNKEDKSQTVDLLSILLNIVEDHGAYEYPVTINSVKAIVFVSVHFIFYFLFVIFLLFIILLGVRTICDMIIIYYIYIHSRACIII
ncbi:hypothetical protein HN51_023667, partial [Arachis hypogaea]